jgi:hypothetical protein
MQGAQETHRLGQADKSAVAKHSIEAGQNIDFNNITILDKVTRYMDRLVKEAIEIRNHPSNFSRDGSFTLSRAWQPVTNMLKQSGEPRKSRAKQRKRLTPPTSSCWLGSSHKYCARAGM